MKLNNIRELLDAELLVECADMSLEHSLACGADLMSDVIAYVKESNMILLTGLVNPQVIRTAEMMDIKAIIFVRGKNPGDQVLELAREKGIAVVSTGHTMFEACGRLYSAGITGKGACY
jgi:predicted transcriptional regulator